jgi:hypothetical protein
MFLLSSLLSHPSSLLPSPMKIHLDSPPEEVQIQIIPLIDVIFCILTFFILAALQPSIDRGRFAPGKNWGAANATKHCGDNQSEWSSFY